MKSGWRILAMLVLAAALVGAAGCSDDDTPGGSTIIPATRGPGGNVTPFPTPRVTDNRIDSEKGYTATFPEGWNLHANVVQTTDASVDAFFEPLVPGAKVQPNISVNCIVVKSADPARYVEAMKTNTVRQGLNKDIVVSQRPMAGLTADVLAYRFESQQGQQAQVDANGTPVPASPVTPLDKTDYLFSDRHCDWQVTTVTAFGDRAKYQPVFDAFLDSFKLKP